MTGRIHVNGVEIAYSLEGPAGAPAVALCHSLATNRTLWRDHVAWLRTDYRVLTFDLRGHGESEVVDRPTRIEDMARDVAALLDTLRIGRAVFVGLSIGGMVGQALALHHPDRLRGLVLCSTTSRTPPEARRIWDERIRAVREGGVETQVEPTLARWFTAPFRATRPDVVGRVADMIRATSAPGFIRAGEAVRDMDLTDRLGAITLPTLVLVGREDPGTPVAMSEIIHRAISGSELLVIPEASHQLVLEKSDAFAEALGAYLDRLPTA